MVTEGQPAPDFELQSDAGETVRLSDLRGKPVVIYFYPRDDTPGCTKQACGIRDAWSDFKRTGAVVLGGQPRRRGVAHQVPGQVRPALHAPGRLRPRAHRALRVLGREE